MPQMYKFIDTISSGNRWHFHDFVFLEQLWLGTFLLCREESVGSQSKHVTLQHPPPFCFNFF